MLMKLLITSNSHSEINFAPTLSHPAERVRQINLFTGSGAHKHEPYSHKTRARDDNASANNNLLREINFFNDARFLHKNDKWVNNNIF